MSASPTTNSNDSGMLMYCPNQYVTQAHAKTKLGVSQTILTTGKQDEK